MQFTIRYLALPAALAAGAFFACSGSGSSTTEARQGQEVADAGAADADAGDAGVDLTQPQLAVCSDAQAADLLGAINQGEIDVAQAVVDQLEDASAKAFARRMVAEHTALGATLKIALNQAGITPEESDNSNDIRQSTKSAIADLQSKSGAELDRAYIAHELLEHVMVLGVADHLIAPSIKDESLLAVATAARAKIAEHAQLASDAQTSVGGQCGAGKEDAGAGDAGAADAGEGGAGDAGAGDAGAGDAGGGDAGAADGGGGADAGEGGAADAGGQTME
jgi:putative membrane protein